MSRIGKLPIQIPSGVSVTVSDDNVVTVKGPKGTLAQSVNSQMGIEIKDGVLQVSRPNDQKQFRAMHGLYRALINNMVVGVTQGYQKELEVNGQHVRLVMMTIAPKEQPGPYMQYIAHQASRLCAQNDLSFLDKCNTGKALRAFFCSEM